MLDKRGEKETMKLKYTILIIVLTNQLTANNINSFALHKGDVVNVEKCDRWQWCKLKNIDKNRLQIQSSFHF